MRPQNIANTERPSIVRAALGYSDRYQSDAELDSLRPLHSTPRAIPNYPRTPTSSSQRHAAFNPLGNQGTVRSRLAARSQNMETHYQETIAERRGLRKSVCVDFNGGREEGGNGRARKRRYGIDRVNSYDTGCAIHDAETPFSEGIHSRQTFGLRAMTHSLLFMHWLGLQRTTVPSSVESMGQMGEGSGAETQGDSGYGGKRCHFFG